jgi:hypothetical protein
MIENFQKHFIFEFWILNFAFWLVFWRGTHRKNPLQREKELTADRFWQNFTKNNQADPCTLGTSTASPPPQQHMQASWTPPVNTIHYRAPDFSLMRPFSPVHTDAVPLYIASSTACWSRACHDLHATSWSLVMTCQRFPSVVGGCLKSVIFSLPDTGCHLMFLSWLLHYHDSPLIFLHSMSRSWHGYYMG